MVQGITESDDSLVLAKRTKHARRAPTCLRYRMTHACGHSSYFIMFAVTDKRCRYRESGKYTTQNTACNRTREVSTRSSLGPTLVERTCVAAPCKLPASFNASPVPVTYEFVSSVLRDAIKSSRADCVRRDVSSTCTVVSTY